MGLKKKKTKIQENKNTNFILIIDIKLVMRNSLIFITMKWIRKICDLELNIFCSLPHEYFSIFMWSFFLNEKKKQNLPVELEHHGIGPVQ